MNLAELHASIMEKGGPSRLVTIAGPGGAGKSILAQKTPEAAGEFPVVHHDHLPAADNPIDWWPGLLGQVIEPLVRGRLA